MDKKAILEYLQYHFKKIIKPIYITLIVIFFGWIFLFGQSVQQRYNNFTLIGLVIFLIMSFLYKKQPKFTYIDLVLFIYLFSVTLTLVFCENKTVALEWHKLYILPIPFVYLSFRNIEKKDIFIISWSIFIFSTLIVIIGILEAIFRKNIIYELWIENPFYERFIYKAPRIMSTLVHPTILGSFLLSCFPFSFFLASQIRKPYKILIRIMIPLLILGVIFSFSRGNIVGLIGMGLIYLYVKKKICYIKFIILGLLILIILSSTILKRDFSFARYSLRGLSLPWWICEIEKSRITLKILKQYPLLGIGLNHYRLKFDQYSSYKYKQIEEQIKKGGRNPYEWKIPDNMYLSILAETGLLGFSSFVLFLFLLLKKCFHILKVIKHTVKKEFLIAYLCGITGLLISMNTYDLLYWINPLLLFWFMIGVSRSQIDNIEG